MIEEKSIIKCISIT